MFCAVLGPGSLCGTRLRFPMRYSAQVPNVVLGPSSQCGTRLGFSMRYSAQVLNAVLGSVSEGLGVSLTEGTTYPPGVPRRHLAHLECVSLTRSKKAEVQHVARLH
ncbi:hypothetical protein O3P69_001333 [Scylla paramamosain]|uniref:Uncharacterized protein n=1 Tax=Scylla paramamosain TaxID=85552 RepID=A0AAW0UPV6_SCYPA